MLKKVRLLLSLFFLICSSAFAGQNVIGNLTVTGNTGLGTSSPGNRLDVQGTVSSNFLNVTTTTTNPASENLSSLTYNIESVFGFNQQHIGEVLTTQVPVDNGNNLSSVTGLDSAIFDYGGGSIGSMNGIIGEARNRGAGSISLMEGMNFVVSNGSTGSIGTAAGLEVGITSAGGGNIGSAFGAYIDASAASGGTINNNYGLYIENQSGIASSDNYAIYSAGGQSYFNDNVGIGSLAPGQKLDVQGTVRATSYLGDGSQLTGISSPWSRTSPYIYPTTITDNVGIGTVTPGQKLDIQGTVRIDNIGTAALPSLVIGTANNTGIWNPATSTLAVSTAGSERMRVTSTGNVGIGTFKPSNLLAVAGAASIGSATFAGVPAPSNGLSVDGNVFIGSPTNILGNTSKLWIYGGDAGANIDVMGNPSVSDQSVIELEGGDYATNFDSLRLQEYGSSGTGTTFGFNNQTLGALIWQNEVTAVLGVSGNTTPLIFVTNDTEKMRLLSSGNLGIGSTLPGQKLDVQGTVRATALIKSGGTSSQFLKADGSTDPSAYLTGNQTITLSNDVTGSGTTAITTTLKNTGTAGTYRSTTFDAQGRETSGTNPTTFAGYGISDSSANLRSALTDSTGTGVAVFGTAPNLTANVGIGSANPGQALDVNGTVRAIGISIRGGTSSQFLKANGTTDSTTYGTGNGSVTSVATDSTLTGGAITTTGTLGINLANANTWTGTPTFSNATFSGLFTGGNVGIGTTTPVSKLDMGTNVIGFGGNVVTDSTAGLYWHTSGAGLPYSISRTAGAWTAPYQQLSVNWPTGVIIDGGSLFGRSGTILQPSGGNVGIGTTNPQSLLTVGTATTALQVSGAGAPFLVSGFGSPTSAIENKNPQGTTEGATLLLYANDGTAMTAGNRLGGFFFGGSSSATSLRNTAGVFSFAEQNWVDGSAYGSYLTFNVNNNNAIVRTERMRITAAGNVGIGTAVPNNALVIKGSIAQQWGINTPAISACGTSPAVKGTDNDFQVTVGTVAATGCTASFGGTYQDASCSYSSQAVITAATYTVSATAFTITATGLVGDILNVHCGFKN